MKPAQRETVSFSIRINFRAAAEPCAFVAAAVLLFVPFFRSARAMVQQHQLRPPICLHHVIAATGKQLPQLLLIQLAGDRQSVDVQSGIKCRTGMVHNVQPLTARNRNRPRERQLAGIIGHHAAQLFRVFTNPRMDMFKLVAAHDGRKNEHWFNAVRLRKHVAQRNRLIDLRLPFKNVRSTFNQAFCPRNVFALHDQQLFLCRHFTRVGNKPTVGLHRLRPGFSHFFKRVPPQIVEHRSSHKCAFAFKRQISKSVRRSAQFPELLGGGFLIQRALLRRHDRLLTDG